MLCISTVCYHEPFSIRRFSHSFIHLFTFIDIGGRRVFVCIFCCCSHSPQSFQSSKIITDKRQFIHKIRKHFDKTETMQKKEKKLLKLNIFRKEFSEHLISFTTHGQLRLNDLSVSLNVNTFILHTPDVQISNVLLWSVCMHVCV